MISQISVHSPVTLPEAFGILQQESGRVKVLAGGTDLLVALNARVEVPAVFLNIWGLRELRGIADAGDHLRLGALTTYTQIIHSPLLLQHAPILVQASRLVGAAQIQNRGTLGGNIANASPAGDTLPVLAVLEADLEIGSGRGIRKIPFNQFYTGYRQTLLAPDELLLAVCLPKPAGEHWQYFRKVGTRQAQAISKVVAAIAGRKNRPGRIEFIRIAYGSVAPTVIRAAQTEALLAQQTLSQELIERARQSVMQEVHPISDVRSTEAYRRLISGNILARALREWQR